MDQPRRAPRANAAHCPTTEGRAELLGMGCTSCRKCLEIFMHATPTYGAFLKRILDENDMLLSQYRYGTAGLVVCACALLRL